VNGTPGAPARASGQIIGETGRLLNSERRENARKTAAECGLVRSGRGRKLEKNAARAELSGCSQ